MATMFGHSGEEGGGLLAMMMMMKMINLLCVTVCVEIVTGLKFSSDCRHLITVSGDRSVNMTSLLHVTTSLVT